MEINIQEKMFSGMIWTFARQFSLQFFAFIQGVILARILAPSDYGLIAMTTFFFAVTGCFTDAGFSTALIRKKNQTAVDYSTVFVTNVCITGFFAIFLCASSPLIANFYKQPFLVKIVCANAVLLFLNSFFAIQNTKLTIDLDFKAQNIIRFITNSTVGVATIAMAILGYGIWSLILPNFLIPIMNGAMYWVHSHWFPGFKFSWKSWKEFFSFGSKMLMSNLLSTTFDNLYPLIIGKRFNATQLGFYTRAQGYADLPSYTLLTVLGPVAFPILCEIQDDKTRLALTYRKLLRVSAYLTFPIFVGISTLAKPLIIIMVTEKWAPSIPYLQILSFAFMWYPLHRINLDLLQVKGRSDLFLRLEIIKKSLCVLILFLSVPFGLIYMCVGLVFSSILCFIINTYYVGKLINMELFQQLKDILPCIGYAVSMGGIILFCNTLVTNLYLQLIVGALVGTAYYFTISTLFKSIELVALKQIVDKQILHKE